MAAAKITPEVEDACGKKSLRAILETPRNVNSSCSLQIKTSKLPRIHEKLRQETSRRSKQNDTSGESPPEDFWIGHRISLPKVRDLTNTESVSSASLSSELSSEVLISLSSKTASFSGSTLDGSCFLNEHFAKQELSKNIMGPSECQSSFDVDNSHINNHTIFMDDSASEESKALKNWEVWMKERRKQNKFFSAKMKRDKCKLVMNAAEDTRRIREDKDLLSYARIETPDKWRGNPNFWKAPAMLPKRGMSNKYCAYKTMSERGIIPAMEFVSVPDAIKMEKDVYSGDQQSMDILQKFGYREQQKKKYAKYLRNIAPHKIEANDLIVIGEKIRPHEKDTYTEETEIPVIEVTPPEEVITSKAEDCVVELVINGVEMRMCENEADTEEYTWNLVFERVQTGVISEKILHVENKGTTAIRYAWLNGKNESREMLFPKRRTMSVPCFFFDKNPGIFLPGQINELKFYHHSKIPGYHSETWFLQLDPKIFENGTVRLTAIAENENTIEDFLKIDEYLNSCVTSHVIKQIVDEIFERAKPELPRPIEYQSLFMEEELFEFQNPGHYYRFEVVEELKSIFKQIPLDQSEEWDLNLFTLESLIRKYMVGQSQRTLLCKFMETTRILLRPGPECYKFNKKHKMLYNALCGIFDGMETSMQRIRDNITKMDSLRGDSESENEIVSGDSLKSDRSQISGLTSLSYPEEANFRDKSISSKSVLQISYRNIFHYQYGLYVTFFNYLCEAAEQAAAIIESCRLFEHHGEVITAENTNFIFGELF